MQASEDQQKMQQELNRLRLHQKYLLETLKSSVLVVDAGAVITSGNEATHAVWGIAPTRLVGRSLKTSELGKLCPELIEKMGLSGDPEPAVDRKQTLETQCKVFTGGEERVIAVVVRPITGDTGEWSGSLIYAEDMTYRKRLQQTVSQLERTSGELQSANEELETTNEELQSTNEELETTNEELQSTNEELETTNEELQSVNEELENMNEELESRTRELNLLSTRYAETLQRMPWPVLMVDHSELIQISNMAAQTLLGVHPSTIASLALDRLPLESSMLTAVLRCARKAVGTREPQVLREQAFRGSETNGKESEQVFDVHFTPVLKPGGDVEGVLVMFGPLQPTQRRRRKESGAQF
jgi:two-component system CheB/CheR fusion protein